MKRIPDNANGLISGLATATLPAPSRLAFEHDLEQTIGLEEELVLVDSLSLEPVPAAALSLRRAGPDARLVPELRAAQVEASTPVCASVEDACRELAVARHVLLSTLDENTAMMAVGTSPVGGSDTAVTALPRYTGIALAYPWAIRQGMPCGLHVHVAVADADRAVAVHDALRSYLPEIAALAANSPFSQGTDTGLSSSRLELVRAFPRSGVPPAHRTYGRFVEFLDWGRRGGAFEDASYLWWDMRLHPVWGTIEIRIADAQTRLGDVEAVATLCHGLTLLACDRYDDGRILPVHGSQRIAENRYRAARDGLTATLLDLDTGRPVPARTRLEQLLDEIAATDACRAHSLRLDAVAQLLLENGAERQRRFAGESGGFPEVVRRLVDESQTDWELDELGLGTVR